VKLNPEALVVTSFETSEEADSILATTFVPLDPTPMTRCYYCPPQTSIDPANTGVVE
jgi:hypothetical protein